MMTAGETRTGGTGAGCGCRSAKTAVVRTGFEQLVKTHNVPG